MQQTEQFHKKQELLLPVGTLEMAQAAVHNGADAIFVGMPGFNARGRSADLSLEVLNEIIQFCHLNGVKVNIAFNIVIFEDEILAVVPLMEKVLKLKPDAFIIQDLGMIRLIREMAPGQVVHASTQMTITNHEAIECLDDLNIKRFVLGRENSLDEIKLIRANTNKELEVFVHGALCVAYSGQCFTSEGIGGRSANRGQCAQSCRFSYQMYVDGTPRQLLDRQYLVSPQDLCGLSEMPSLIDIGVDSFKIEGRLKSPEYVASCAQMYRSVIDAKKQGIAISEKAIETKKNQLAKVYSRGFFSGWLNGVNHQKLVDGSFSSHRGLYIGRVTRTKNDIMEMQIEIDERLSPGDGIRWIYQDKKLHIESGAQIYQINEIEKNQYQLKFSNNVKFEQNLEGAKVYFNHDHKLNAQLDKSYHDKNLRKRSPLRIKVLLHLGKPVFVEFSDGVHVVSGYSESTIKLAEKKPVTNEMIQDELTAFGGTVFQAEKVEIVRSQGEGLFIPHKELKQLRQKLIHELEQRRMDSTIDGFRISAKPEEQISEWIKSHRKHGIVSVRPKFNILLRDKDQVADIVFALQNQKINKGDFHCVILDFEFGRDYLASIELLRQMNITVGVATTRILKPQEYGNLRAIEKMKPDYILVRNLGAFHYFNKISSFRGKLIGDFSLNITNHLTAEYLLEKGFYSLCGSYDLNYQQMKLLLASVDAAKMEVTIHQYMPSFHMEHCVYAAFLSTGSSYRDCGKPCERHKVELEDQFGHKHHIKPDQECRNTMFNAVSQTAASHLNSWIESGLGFVRYEALFERQDELITKIQMYTKLLMGEVTPDQLVKSLHLLERYGLGEGSLAKTQEYVSRKKDLS